MYNELDTLLREEQKLSNSFFIVGYFNVNIGKSNMKNPSIRRYSKRPRNANGEIADFSDIHKLIITKALSQKQILRETRSYSNGLVDNDHRIVLTKLGMQSLKMYPT